MSNCTNISAVNYNSSAITDDGSCIYLAKVNNVCYAFQDVNPALVTDNSFTMSWSLETDNWVFFHDYYPDMFMHVREKLYNLSNGTIYAQSGGAYGKYHDPATHSFFVDIVFPSKSEADFILNTVQWITEVLNPSGKAQEFSTFTHITCWNNYQCTGRVVLSSIFSLLEYSTHRKTQGKWSFNSFRDLLIDHQATFLDDLFHNFSILPGTTDPNLPWYEQELLADNHTVIRFEFDNTSTQQIVLHDADININNSPR